MPELPPPSAEAAAWSLLLDGADRCAAAQWVSAYGDAGSALASRLSGPAPSLRARAQIARRMAECRERGVGLVCREDPDFPPRLRCIPDGPVLLHYRGALQALERTAIAVVGARRASRQGIAIARSLAGELAAAGVLVVSGLALGVDGAAHRGALEAGGLTLAVLGSGVDRIQPISNAPLAEALLAAGGLLVSEYPPGTPAAPFRFPERNRLISGLSLGVVVVEASARSGSLITARCAADQGREVMVVPATPGVPNAAGGNRLLKQGAALVESAEDVFHALGRDLPGDRVIRPAPEAATLTPESVRVLDRLDGQAQSLDSLATRSGLDVPTCAVVLTELELGGFVQRVADGYIRRPSGY